MAILGTSVEGGADFYGRKAQQAGEALGLVVQAMRRREEERKQRELGEIAQFFEVAKEEPSLALTWGADISKKYGAKYPGVEQMVGVLAQRQQLRAETDNAAKAWTDAWDQRQQDYTQKKQEVATAPDMTVMPNVAGFGGMPIPNIGKIVAQDELSRTDPNAFPVEALQNLPPMQQLAARAWAKDKGYEVPMMTPFDPFAHLPADLKAGVAIQRGLLTGDPAQAWRYGEGFEQTPATVARQQFDVEEREAREVSESTDSERALAYMREQMALARRQQERGISGQKEVIDYREGSTARGGKTEGVSWKAIQDQAATAAKEWDARHNEAVSAGGDPKSKAKAHREFLAANPPRPRIVPETQARILAKKVSLLPVGEDEKGRILGGMLEDYQSLVTTGKTLEEIQREKEQRRGDILSKKPLGGARLKPPLTPTQAIQRLLSD